MYEEYERDYTKKYAQNTDYIYADHQHPWGPLVAPSNVAGLYALRYAMNTKDLYKEPT